ARRRRGRGDRARRTPRRDRRARGRGGARGPPIPRRPPVLPGAARGTVARARPGRVARRAAEHRRPDLHRRPARTLPPRTALLGGVHGPLSPAGRAFGVRETRTTGGHASGDPVPAPRG